MIDVTLLEEIERTGVLALSPTVFAILAFGALFMFIIMALSVSDLPPKIAAFCGMFCSVALILCYAAMDTMEDDQNQEIAKTEKIVNKGIDEKYNINDTSIDFKAEDARNVLSKNRTKYATIKVTTHENKKTYGVKMNNKTGEVTLFNARLKEIKPSEI